MSEFDPELIVMQAASTEPDTRMIEALMGDVLRMAHAEESATRICSVEQTFGWNFYIMSVYKAVARRLAQLSESGIPDIKGSSSKSSSARSISRRKQMALTTRSTLTCCRTSSRPATDYFNKGL